MKVLEFKDYDFDSQKELFKALYDNQDKIITQKKSVIYKAKDKGSGSPINTKVIEATKGLDNTQEGFIYPIISTTNYFDSHKDVHFEGCFNKTIKDQQGKIKYVLDHQLVYDSVIAWSKAVKMLKRSIPWDVVGKAYDGNTEALMFEINKENIKRKDVLQDIENKADDFENSIRMIYHKVRLGLNSEAKEHKGNKRYFEKKIDSIANKDEVMEHGYFWGVEELAIEKEGSLVVAGGSNSATSIYEAVSVDTSKQKKTQKVLWLY